MTVAPEPQVTIPIGPQGPARCSRCKHHFTRYDPQPGVSWDRCTVRLSCFINRENDCPDFQRSLLSFVTPTPAFKWWAPYL